MPTNQKLFLSLLLCCLASSSDVRAQKSESDSETKGGADNAAIEEPDKQFINEINKLYRDSREIDKFIQFSKPWRPNQPLAKTALSRAKEEVAKGKYLGACADYLVDIRESVNSKGANSIVSSLDAVSQLVKNLDKDGQRTVCKAMIDLSMDSRRYAFAREHNKDLENIMMLALTIKDQHRDHDDQLISVLIELGAIRSIEKNYQAAIENYKRALALILETKIEDDAQMMSCVNALSTIYNSQQNYSQTENMLKSLISTLEAQASSENKLSRVPYLLRLYTVYKQSGKLKQAAEVSAKVVAIIDGYNTKPLTKSDNKLASSVAEQMKSSSWGFASRSTASEADESLLKSAFKFKLKVSGFGPWVAYDLASLCQMLSRAGKTEEAIRLYRVSIDTAEDIDDQQTVELLQQRLLALLNSSDRRSEKAQLESSLNQRKEKKNQEAFKESVNRLSEHRAKDNTDQSALLEALLAAASAALEVQKKNDARSYLDEAISVARKLPPPTNAHDNGLNQLWSVTRSYIAHADSKEDEHIVYVVAELDEQRHTSHSRANYSAMDLSSIVRYFIDKRKSAEAEEFLKYVIDLRKHYRPADQDCLIEAYNQLQVVYSSGQSQSGSKLSDTLAELVKLYTAKYGASDSRTMNERIMLALSLIRQNKQDLAEKALLPVLNHLHQLSSKGTARIQDEMNDLNQVAPKLSQVSDAFLIAGSLELAEKYIRQALELVLVDDYHTGASADRVVRTLLNAGQFLRASELIQLRLAIRERGFGVNSFEAAQQRLQLSEVYFKYSRQLAMQGKKNVAKDWSDKSEAAFKQALLSIEASQGADSVAAKDAVKKREMMLNPVVPNVQSGDDVT